MTKLCARGKAAAKRKFRVYPSAYANAYASKICAGKIKDPSGVKRKDFKGPKPAGAQEGVFVQKPKQRRRGKTLGPRRESTEYLKKKKAYDTLVVNDRKKRMSDPRMRPGAKKGALMIMIAVGKKKKVQKKMGGGMTAGSRSALGRLQKAAMMSKGGGADFINTVKPRKRGNPAVVTNSDERAKKKGIIRKANKYSQGGDAKIKKVIKGLRKASKTHAGQAKTLSTIKLRGGGAAIRGTNFKGVF